MRRSHLNALLSRCPLVCRSVQMLDFAARNTVALQKQLTTHDVEHAAKVIQAELGPELDRLKYGELLQGSQKKLTQSIIWCATVSAKALSDESTSGVSVKRTLANARKAFTRHRVASGPHGSTEEAALEWAIQYVKSVVSTTTQAQNCGVWCVQILTYTTCLYVSGFRLRR